MPSHGHNLQKDRYVKRKLYRARRSAGECVKCGSACDRGDKCYCKRCASLHREAQIKRHKRIYPLYKKLGICVHCMKAQAVPNRVACARCVEDHNESRLALKAKRVSNGLCPKCGERPEDGYRQCSKCRDANKRAQVRYRERKKLRAAS